MRLIDADALLDEAMERYCEDCDKRKGIKSGKWRIIYVDDMKCEIEDAPTIDAVPVIRCKDCKWFDTSDISGTVEPIGYRCKKVARLWREPDDFCKGAERKEE